MATVNLMANCYSETGNLEMLYRPLNTLFVKDGGLQPMTTEKLNFKMTNPVEILPVFKYNGSVNLVLNDDLNPPRLINSRFKLIGNSQYAIPISLGLKPIGIVYDEHFLLLSSLLNKILTYPKILLEDVSYPGNMQVGNYVFYIKYSDAEGNLSDLAAESGIVSCFIGTNSIPKSINGGYRILNSNKSIILRISNLDSNYSYLRLFYSKDTGDVDLNRTVEYFEINKLYDYLGDSILIRISGNESLLSYTAELLNAKYRIIATAKTLAVALNRLFLGNITENTDDVKELQDLSLRFTPKLIVNNSTDEIGNVSLISYRDESGNIRKGEYYNIHNIYEKVGYWDDEIYRFGVVYLYDDGRKSNVYNIRGITSLSEDTTFKQFNIFEKTESSDETNSRIYLSYNEDTFIIDGTTNENIKGVVRIQLKVLDNYFFVRSIGINVPENMLEDIQTICPNITGFYFVRLRRIPTILALAVLLPFEYTNSKLPMIPIGDLYYMEKLISDEGLLKKPIEGRLVEATQYHNKNYFAAICPEYSLNIPYYNQLFTGLALSVKTLGNNVFELYSGKEHRYIYSKSFTQSNSTIGEAKVLGIPDGTKMMAIDNNKFRGMAGIAEEAFRVEYIGQEMPKSWKKVDLVNGNFNKYKFNKTNSKLLRGIYGSYLGLSVTSGQFNVGDLINIYIPNYSEDLMSDYFLIRYKDSSEYMAISDYMQLSDLGEIEDTSSNQGDKKYYMLSYEGNNLLLYRGDCFVSNFTHRLNRNFIDPSTPINDKIVDLRTMCYYYNTEPNHVDELVNINRSDVNAVPLGVWISFKCNTARNISLRAEDKSRPDEKSLHGYYRSFYPLMDINSSPDHNLPESNILNDGYGTTTSKVVNFKHDGTLYSETDYSNRIVYSEIAVDSKYANGMKVFPMKNYEDYNWERGELTKIIEINGNLLCVFEHGVAWANVNEKIQATNTGQEEVFLSSNKVLPHKLQFLSSEYGSQWKDSIIKTNSGNVYGVDTSAKKIWVVSGNRFLLISDLVLNEFLNKNIPFKEHDLDVYIGSKNVKTHYNAAKGDVMFTLYSPKGDNLETAWNLCYNDITQKWITFYSWVPVESLNVNNVMYSIDRDYVKLINYLNHE